LRGVAIDLDALYAEYLTRFDRQVGRADVGAFAKYEGRLIKKLSRDEFEPAFLEYAELAGRYHDNVENGDTINDAMVKMLRDHAAKLVLKPPA
jgi:hypothetical protein